MRSRTACAIGLLVALHGHGASTLDVKRRDGIHRIEKTHVTTIFHEFNLFQRDASATACPASHDLCPSSLSGGCCPDRYDCATDSCYAATNAPQTCAGKVGHYACAAEQGGGCCPEGLICRRGDRCEPPEGSTYSQDCPNSYFLCPSSVNFGCCPNGMGCASNACYSTEASTFVVTSTVTTTDSDDDEITTTVESTVVSTPRAPSEAPTDDIEDVDDAQVVFKYYPSSVPKVDPDVSSDSSDDGGGGGGGGLTTGQIVGIVVGVVGLLIIVLVAAFIIIRHLNKVIEKVGESQKGTTSAGSYATTSKRPEMVHHRTRDKPSHSEVDVMSIDPLYNPSPRPQHRRADSDSDGTIGFAPGVGLGTPSHGTTPSPRAHYGGYQAVPTGQTGAESRHTSYDSGMNAFPTGYFDTAPTRAQRGSGQSQQVPLQRYSIDSQGTQPGAQPGYYGPSHGRQWADASEASMPDHLRGGGAVSPTHHELDGVGTVMTPELPAEPTSAFSPVSPEPGREREWRRSVASNVSIMSNMTGVMGLGVSATGGGDNNNSSSSNNNAAATAAEVSGASSSGAGGRAPPLSQGRRRSAGSNAPTDVRGRSDSGTLALPTELGQGTLSVVAEDSETMGTDGSRDPAVAQAAQDAQQQRQPGPVRQDSWDQYGRP